MHRFVHFLIAVSDADRKNPSEEVQVLIAVGVPDKLVLRASQHQRLAEVMKNSREQALLLRQKDLLLGHAFQDTTCTQSILGFESILLRAADRSGDCAFRMRPIPN